MVTTTTQRTDGAHPYVELSRVPGGVAMSASGFVARLPISMLGIGYVLLVSQATGSYALAGAVSATSALALALVAPAVSRMVDRFGQTRVAPTAMAIHAVGLIGLIVAVDLDWPAWTFLAFAVLTAFLPNIGSFVRARWATMLPGRPLLRTAMSVESVIDELVFVVGPPLVTILAASQSPSVALTLVLVIGVAGLALFLRQRSSEPEPQPHHGGAGSLLRLPGMVPVLMVSLWLGGAFGAVEVVTVAWGREVGHSSWSGLVLATWALGSLIAGLIYGARHSARSLDRQLVLGSTAFALLLMGLLLPPSLGQLCVVALASGFGIAPTIIVVVSCVERLVPAARITEGLTWVTTGIVLGVAAAAPLAGWVVDQAGVHRAYIVPVVSALAGAAFAIGSRRRVGVALGASPAVEPLPA